MISKIDLHVYSISDSTRIVNLTTTKLTSMFYFTSLTYVFKTDFIALQNNPFTIYEKKKCCISDIERTKVNTQILSPPNVRTDYNKCERLRPRKSFIHNSTTLSDQVTAMEKFSGSPVTPKEKIPSSKDQLNRLQLRILLNRLHIGCGSSFRVRFVTFDYILSHQYSARILALSFASVTSCIEHLVGFILHSSMCDIVWSSPHWHFGSSVRPHFIINDAVRAQPTRIRLIVRHIGHFSLYPGARVSSGGLTGFGRVSSIHRFNRSFSGCDLSMLVLFMKLFLDLSLYATSV